MVPESRSLIEQLLHIVIKASARIRSSGRPGRLTDESGRFRKHFAT
jgi:hypothetical protein